MNPVASTLRHLDLADRILACLLPRGLRERARHLVARGWTASQVEVRLPEDVRAALRAEGGAVERVHGELVGLVRAGRARSRRVRYTVALNTKGPRDMLVDVFWAVSPPPPSS